MKLVIAFLTLLLSFSEVYWEDINVSARVWAPNIPSEVENIIPSFSPVVIKWWDVQYFFIAIKDKEWDSLSYTITPEKWAVSNLSWTITNQTALQNWTAFINFAYLAPSWASDKWASKITITLNDWNSITVEDIDVYIF